MRDAIIIMKYWIAQYFIAQWNIIANTFTYPHRTTLHGFIGTT